MAFTHTYSLHAPAIEPDRAAQIALAWLNVIGARDVRSTPAGLTATFGTGLSFGWKRNAKKILGLVVQPADPGSHIHLRIELTAAHADEVALFSGKILHGWQEFANELWAQYGGGTTVTSALVVSPMRAMSAGKRAGYLVLGALMLLGLVPLGLYTRGFILWSLGGAFIAGGLFALAAGIIGKEPASRPPGRP